MANPEVWGIVESNQCFLLFFVAHLQGILAALGTAAVSSWRFLTTVGHLADFDLVHPKN